MRNRMGRQAAGSLPACGGSVSGGWRHEGFELLKGGVEGRKIFAEGRLFAGDLLTAEAEGIFVSIGPECFQALVAERARRLRGA